MAHHAASTAADQENRAFPDGGDRIVRGVSELLFLLPDDGRIEIAQVSYSAKTGRYSGLEKPVWPLP